MLPRKASSLIKASGTKLDAAIATSLFAMGALNLLVLTDQLGPSRAYAATPCHCILSGVALA